MKTFTFVSLGDIHIREVTEGYVNSRNIAVDVNGHSILKSDHPTRPIYFAIRYSECACSYSLEKIIDYTRRDHWPSEPVIAP